MTTQYTAKCSSNMLVVYDCEVCGRHAEHTEVISCTGGSTDDNGFGAERAAREGLEGVMDRSKASPGYWKCPYCDAYQSWMLDAVVATKSHRIGLIGAVLGGVIILLIFRLMEFSNITDLGWAAILCGTFLLGPVAGYVITSVALDGYARKKAEMQILGHASRQHVGKPQVSFSQPE